MKNKCFSIICIFLLILLLFSSFMKVKASNLVTYIDFDSETTFEAPQINNDGHPYYFVHNSYGTCYTILDNKDGYFYLSSSSPRRIFASCSSKCYFLNSSGDGWYWVTDNAPGQVSNVDSVDEDFGIIDFHCTVYTDINKSNVFFQVAPLTRVMLVEKAEKKTVQEILGVLPLIIVVVVSFLGLRKALNWLLTLLRRS